MVLFLLSTGTPVVAAVVCSSCTSAGTRGDQHVVSTRGRSLIREFFPFPAEKLFSQSRTRRSESTRARLCLPKNPAAHCVVNK